MSAAMDNSDPRGTPTKVNGSRRGGRDEPTLLFPETPNQLPLNFSSNSFSDILPRNGISDLPTPGRFSSVDVSYMADDYTNFGDLPTPADRSESVASAVNINLGVESVFDGWEIGDRYQIERIIGRGSYGEVVQAIDLQFAILSYHVTVV